MNQVAQIANNRDETDSPSRFGIDGAVVYVAGHRGLAGSAVWRALEATGRQQMVGASSQ